MIANPTPTTADADGQSPRQILRRAARALKIGRGLTALAIGGVAAAVVLGAWLVADSRLRFGAAGRWAGLLAIALPLAGALASALRSWLPRLDDAALARRLETTTGRTDNALVNAVQLDRALDGNSPWRAVLLGELAGLWRGIAWQQVYDWRLLRRWAAAAGALLLLGTALFAWRPTEFRQRVGRVLLPVREIAPLTRTRVVAVTPGDRVVTRGSVLAMQVTLAGEAPAEVWLVVTTGDGRVERHATQRASEAMAWAVNCKWPESGRYRFEAGDARSFERRIDVQVPAKVIARQLSFAPPPYTRLPSAHVPDGAPWPAIPEGSAATLEWTFDRAVKALSVEHDDALARATSRPESWQLAGKVAVNRAWCAHWTDAAGLSDQGRVLFNVKADEAPRVRWIQPTGEEELLLTRDASLHLSFEARDDYGLAEVALCRGTPDKPAARVMEEWRPNTPAFKQATDIQLARWVGAEETEAWFCVVARDGNDVTGPGRTLSRMLVVRIVTPEELRRATDTRQAESLDSLDDLLRLQQTNLDATRAMVREPQAAGDAAVLVERETRIGEAASQLIATTPAGSAAWRDVLGALTAKEIPQAVLALRAAAAAATGEVRRGLLVQAEALEASILARLKNLPADLRDEAGGAAVRDLIGRVEALFNRQKALHGRTLKAVAGEGPAMAQDQDALADESRGVRKALADGALNSGLGDATFRKVLDKAAALMVSSKIYEQMIRSAEQIEGGHFPEAAALAKQVLVDLARVLELLNTSQHTAAADKADSLKEAAEGIREKLTGLVDQQRAVVEKSKQLAAKDEFRPEDVATAKELAAEKAAIAALIEQMLTDAHAFPDLKPMNELREELTKIYEDVIQQDTAQAAAGQLKPNEIAVQKEESLLADLEKAAKTSEDMEMWLPDKNETTKWLMENFDLTEMPEIPNLPLPDSFTDLVGDLLKEQEGLAEQVKDAASNNALAVNPANGWEVADGPMPGFNAQGKSGNTRPNENEQTGRSSGGREGMSNGEMVNQRADRLEGSAIQARRTSDPMQKGQVQDDGPPADAKATGGGKAGGVSQRAGMTGEGPLRAVNSPDQLLNNALASEQALLAQQTAKSYATARLFYLRSGPLPEVARLMDESRDALKSGRLAEYQALHRRIVAGLRQLGAGAATEPVKVLGSTGSRVVGEKRLPGGADGAVPAGFQQPVDDYFHSLDTP